MDKNNKEREIFTLVEAVGRAMPILAYGVVVITEDKWVDILEAISKFLPKENGRN